MGAFDEASFLRRLAYLVGVDDLTNCATLSAGSSGGVAIDVEIECPDATTLVMAAKTLKKEGIIRLKKNEIEGKLTLPTKLAGKCSQVLHKWCDIKKQDYGGGKMIATIAFTPGDLDGLAGEIGKMTGGDYQLELPDGMYGEGGGGGGGGGGGDGGKKGKKDKKKKKAKVGKKEKKGRGR